MSQSTPIKMLFMCPHSAGKSLAAATYFRSAAHRAGLAVEIAIAGPDPDDVVMPTVAAALSAEGFSVDWSPRLVQAHDLLGAATVVSIGCNADVLPAQVEMIDWDVPSPSADLAGCLQAIHSRCETLARGMA